MNKAANTREILLTHACQFFWARGFSNVSVREISKAAGVDVALISRYFGSKQGLFEATLDTLPAIDPTKFSGPDALIEMLVNMYSTTPRDGTKPSPISMIMMNANDSEVGILVQETQYLKWQKPIEDIIGHKGKAALFFAALMGFSVAEKSLHLKGIAAPGTAEYEAQLRHVLSSALVDPED